MSWSAPPLPFSGRRSRQAHAQIGTADPITIIGASNHEGLPHGGVPPPRWGRRSAWLAVLTTVPSGLWRMATAVGIPVGVSDQIRHEHYGFPGWGRRTCSGSHSCWSASPCPTASSPTTSPEPSDPTFASRTAARAAWHVPSVRSARDRRRCEQLKFSPPRLSPISREQIERRLRLTTWTPAPQRGPGF